MTAFFFTIHSCKSAQELPFVSAHLRQLMCKCMIWSNAKPLSGIKEFSTCILKCANICFISSSVSLPSKNSVMKVVNGISIVTTSITSYILTIILYMFGVFCSSWFHRLPIWLLINALTWYQLLMVQELFINSFQSSPLFLRCYIGFIFCLSMMFLYSFSLHGIFNVFLVPSYRLSILLLKELY